MRKAFLLALLLFSFQYTKAYAQDTGPHDSQPEFIKVSLSQDKPDTHTLDDWSTSLAIYSLIIGVYTIYWFRQNT